MRCYCMPAKIVLSCHIKCLHDYCASKNEVQHSILSRIMSGGSRAPKNADAWLSRDLVRPSTEPCHHPMEFSHHFEKSRQYLSFFVLRTTLFYVASLFIYPSFENREYQPAFGHYLALLLEHEIFIKYLEYSMGVKVNHICTKEPKAWAVGYHI